MPNDQPKRNIDDRLDAIVQSLELLASMHRDLETGTDKRFAETDKRFAQVAKLFAETGQFINDLAHVAKDHEQRIDDLEK